MKHADEPLCPYCREDRHSMVTAMRDGRRVVWSCSTCGKSWPPAEPRRVTRDGYFDGQTFHVDAPQDY